MRLAALVLMPFIGACSSNTPGGDLPDPEEIITFSTPLVVQEEAKSSRASLITGVLPQGTEFGVLGYCIPLKLSHSGSFTDADYEAVGGSSTWEVKKNFLTPDVIYKGQLTVEDNGCYYSAPAGGTATPAIWYTSSSPKVAGTNVNTSAFKYTFVAYYPYDGRFTVSPEGEHGIGAPKLTYTVIYGHATDDPHGNGIGSATNRIERHPDITQDAMYAFTRDHVRASGAVDLTFHHIFCGLSVQLNNFSEESPVTVNSVTISGAFYRSATIDFSQPDPTTTVSDDKYWGTFQFLGATGDGANRTPVPVEIPKQSSIIAGATADAPDGTVVFLLPNQNDGEKQFIGTNKVITVDFDYNGNHYTKTIDGFSLGRIPQSGVVYKLNINFLGDHIVLMLTADEIEYWEPGSDNEIIIN